MSNKRSNSVIDLLAYQRESFRDKAWIVADCWSRQAGKDFTSACAGVDRSMQDHRPWYIVATTQGQADETFDKCRSVAEAYKQAYRLSGQITGSDSAEYVDYDPEIEEAFRCTARTLHLPGGGKVVSLPGRNPDTLAGKTGNIILTEFALFPGGGYGHWRVIFPLTTRGYFARVISTPRGKNTKFSELIHQDTNRISVHRVDVYRAVADGLRLKDPEGKPITIEELKAIYGDQAGWEREYELKETGDLEALVKWAQLTAASQAECKPLVIEVKAGAGWQAGLLGAHLKGSLAAWPGSRLECGWDVARHGDLSSFWVNLRQPRRPAELSGLVIMQNTQFSLQRDIVREGMKAGPSVGVGDATGLGADSNETLEHEFPKRWNGLTFTAKSKAMLGSRLMTAYDDGSQVLPAMESYKWIQADIYAVQKEGDKDNLKLSESENPLRRESHCDIAYSNALALEASQIPLSRGHVWAA